MRNNETFHQVDMKNQSHFGSNGSTDNKNETLSVPGFMLSNDLKNLFMKSVSSLSECSAKGKYHPFASVMDDMMDLFSSKFARFIVSGTSWNSPNSV